MIPPIVIFLSVLFYYDSIVYAWKLSFHRLFMLHGRRLCSITLHLHLKRYLCVHHMPCHCSRVWTLLPASACLSDCCRHVWKERRFLCFHWGPRLRSSRGLETRTLSVGVRSCVNITVTHKLWQVATLPDSTSQASLTTDRSTGRSTSFLCSFSPSTFHYWLLYLSLLLRKFHENREFFHCVLPQFVLFTVYSWW